jgi:hypothetical protein
VIVTQEEDDVDIDGSNDFISSLVIKYLSRQMTMLLSFGEKDSLKDDDLWTVTRPASDQPEHLFCIYFLHCLTACTTLHALPCLLKLEV